MQINNIYIDNFSLEKNVFIKDLSLRGQATDYWKYRIDGVDYYIPNLGYLVMIDSNFRDVEIMEQDMPLEKAYKLNGEIFDGDMIKNTRDINIFEMFKRSFNNNNFGNEFKRYGCVSPPSEITNF